MTRRQRWLGTLSQRLLHTLEDRYGPLVDANADVVIAFAIQRARLLIGASAQHRGLAVARTLETGQHVALFCTNRAAPLAYADKEHGIYLAVLYAGIIQTIHWLSLRVWSCARFLPSIGTVARDVCNPASTGIPPGLELVWWSVHVAANAELPILRPTWLGEAYEAMDTRRRDLMGISLVAAIDYLWLHELGHSFCGHVDLAKGRRLHDSERQALEVEADRWALGKLFESLHESLAADRHDEYSLTAATIGVTLCHIVCHSYQLLMDRDSASEPASHPPLWFRADDVRKSERLAACRFNARPQVAGVQENTNLGIRQARLDCLILEGYLQLGRVHPLFGAWLGPLVDNSRESAGRGLLEQYAKALLNQKDRLDKLRF